MASIPRLIISGRISAADALTVNSLDYTTRIANHPRVTDWFTPFPSKTTLVDPAAAGGTVTGVASRRTGSANTLWTNVPTLQRPNYTASDPGLNGRPAVIHDSGGTGDQLNYNGAFPAAADFFKVAVVNFAAAPAATRYPGLSSSTAGNYHLFTATSTGLFSFRIGPSAQEARASVAFRTGPTCLIGCWNAAAKRARLSIDLGASWSQDIKAGAVGDSLVGMQVGQTSDFRWYDQGFGNIDLSGSDETASDLLTEIADYMRDIVGIPT